jgi:hypothetical protein
LDLPYLLFEPSTLDGHSQSHRVKATVNGILPGTVGLWNNEVDGVKMVGSNFVLNLKNIPGAFGAIR